MRWPYRYGPERKGAFATMQQEITAEGTRVAFGLALGGSLHEVSFERVATSVHVLGGVEALDDDAWDALGAAAAEPNPFAERSFVQAATVNLAQGAGARSVMAWSGAPGASQLIGSFPFQVGPRYGRMPIRHVASWTRHHSFLGTSMVRSGREASAWAAILRTLDAADWAPGLLHVTGLVENGPTHLGLAHAAAALGRPCDVVHRFERALLQSDLSPDIYYEAAVRGKKRKELRRLRSRLAELGTVAVRRSGPGDDVGAWCELFLALEASGWKGEAGSALASDGGTARFFREVIKGAHTAGRLGMIRLDLDGRPIAMLVNLFAAHGAFSFKIAYDETFARYSPGVLIELENYAILDRPDVAWADSCAVEDHPMINSLWAERRGIVRVSVPLAGWRRRGLFRAARFAENLAARARSRAERNQPTKGDADD